MEQVTYSNSPHTLHQQLGWNACGINGCILAEHHAGVCVFPDLRRTRRQHEQSSGLDGSSAPRFSRPVGRPPTGAVWNASLGGGRASGKRQRAAPGRDDAADRTSSGAAAPPLSAAEAAAEAAAEESVSAEETACSFHRSQPEEAGDAAWQPRRDGGPPVGKRLRKVAFTPKEDEAVLRLRGQGMGWAKVAAQLPGRSVSSVTNRHILLKVRGRGVVRRGAAEAAAEEDGGAGAGAGAGVGEEGGYQASTAAAAADDDETVHVHAPSEEEAPTLGEDGFAYAPHSTFDAWLRDASQDETADATPDLAMEAEEEETEAGAEAPKAVVAGAIAAAARSAAAEAPVCAPDPAAPPLGRCWQEAVRAAADHILSRVDEAGTRLENINSSRLQLKLGRTLDSFPPPLRRVVEVLERRVAAACGLRRAELHIHDCYALLTPENEVEPEARAPQRWHLDAVRRFPVAALLLRGGRWTEFAAGPYSDFSAGVPVDTLERWCAPWKDINAPTWESGSAEERDAGRILLQAFLFPPTRFLFLGVGALDAPPVQGAASHVGGAARVRLGGPPARADATALARRRRLTLLVKQGPPRPRHRPG